MDANLIIYMNPEFINAYLNSEQSFALEVGFDIFNSNDFVLMYIGI